MRILRRVLCIIGRTIAYFRVLWIEPFQRCKIKGYERTLVDQQAPSAVSIIVVVAFLHVSLRRRISPRFRYLHPQNSAHLKVKWKLRSYEVTKDLKKLPGCVVQKHSFISFTGQFVVRRSFHYSVSGRCVFFSSLIADVDFFSSKTTGAIVILDLYKKGLDECVVDFPLFGIVVYTHGRL